MTGADPVEALLADMLEFLAAGDVTFEAARDAWRTSCPRLPVWEEAAERGFVVRAELSDGRPGLLVTQAGRAFLAHARQTPATAPIQGA